MVPTDESSSLHVETPVPRGRESNLSRSSFDIHNSVRDAIQRGAAENEVQKMRCKNMKRSLHVLRDK